MLLVLVCVEVWCVCGVVVGGGGHAAGAGGEGGRDVDMLLALLEGGVGREMDILLARLGGGEAASEMDRVPVQMQVCWRGGEAASGLDRVPVQMQVCVVGGRQPVGWIGCRCRCRCVGGGGAGGGCEGGEYASAAAVWGPVGGAGGLGIR